MAGIVAAVADGHDLLGRNAEFFAQRPKRDALAGVRIHNLQINIARAGHEIRKLRQISHRLFALFPAGERHIEFFHGPVPSGDHGVQIIDKFVRPFKQPAEVGRIIAFKLRHLLLGIIHNTAGEEIDKPVVAAHMGIDQPRIIRGQRAVIERFTGFQILRDRARLRDSVADLRKRI